MFRIRCKRKFGFQASIYSSLLDAVVCLSRLCLQSWDFKYQRLSFLTIAARFQLSSFRFGFKNESLCRIRRCCFESLLWKAGCSRLHEEFVKVQYFTKLSLVERVESWHVWNEQPRSIWLLRRVESLFWKVRCSRLHGHLVRNPCFTNPSRVVGFERWHVWSEKEARKCVIAPSYSTLL
jgi:hypothetical protein